MRLAILIILPWLCVISGCDSRPIDNDNTNRSRTLEESDELNLERDNPVGEQYTNSSSLESEKALAIEQYQNELRARREKSLSDDLAEVKYQLDNRYLGVSSLNFLFSAEEINCRENDVGNLSALRCFLILEQKLMRPRGVITVDAMSRLLKLLSDLNYISLIQHPSNTSHQIMIVRQSDLSDEITFLETESILSIPVFEITEYRDVSVAPANRQCNRPISVKINVRPQNLWGEEYVSLFGSDGGYFCFIGFENFRDAGLLNAGMLFNSVIR